ncbi:hypothetical protein ACS0TY_022489 [Phlomoides rotata]
MRVFKWTPNFDVSHEAPIALVWVRFTGLPTHLIHRDALFTIAKPITKFEIDIYGVSYTQRVVYENRPKYCKGSWVTSSLSVTLWGISLILSGVVGLLDGMSVGDVLRWVLVVLPIRVRLCSMGRFRGLCPQASSDLEVDGAGVADSGEPDYWHACQVSSAPLADGTRFDVLEEGELGVVKSAESGDSEESDGPVDKNADNDERIMLPVTRLCLDLNLWILLA